VLPNASSIATERPKGSPATARSLSRVARIRSGTGLGATWKGIETPNAAPSETSRTICPARSGVQVHASTPLVPALQGTSGVRSVPSSKVNAPEKATMLKNGSSGVTDTPIGTPAVAPPSTWTSKWSSPVGNTWNGADAPGGSSTVMACSGHVPPVARSNVKGMVALPLTICTMRLASPHSVRTVTSSVASTAKPFPS
jgi:hypothetical protein